MAGSLAFDHYAERVDCRPGSVIVTGPDGTRYSISHDGDDAIRPGEKRMGRARLVEQLAVIGLPADLAGGMWNSLMAITTLGQKRSGIRPVATVHDIYPDDEVIRHFWQRSVTSRTLGIAPIPCNLIFANGNDRSILRDPVPAVSAPLDIVRQLAQESVADAHVAVLNSVKNVQLFEALLEEARTQDRPVVVALTSSPSWSWLMQAACGETTAAVVGNWTEWRTVLARTGEPLPDVSEEAVSREVLASIPARAWRAGCLGDIVCTLGRAGLILGEERTGRTWQVRLDEDLRRCVQDRLVAHPELRNGMGDWLLGAWVAQRWTKNGERDPLTAAQQATFDILTLRKLLPAGVTVDGVLVTEIGVTPRCDIGDANGVFAGVGS
jgi:hypothetical protein